MPLRILHTSDWHLGHTLHQVPRHYEHCTFLDWLIAQAVERRIDAMLITGDVFDSANPPASAEAMWFEFLAHLTSAVPGIDVVVIAGNHDSAHRLSAPAAVVEPHGVRIVGQLPVGRGPSGGLEILGDELAIPLHRDGRVEAWVAAVPYLRAADLSFTGASLESGVAEVYRQVCDAVRARVEPGQSLVVTGHLYAAGTEVSRLSERRILGGNEHALCHRIFPADAAYVALGHLHKAQRVGSDHIRYAGSPIPLSLAEAHYRHQVVIAELDGGDPAVVSAIPIPRSVPILRVPRAGSLPPEKLTPLLEALEDAEQIADVDRHTRPYLEVVALLEQPEPHLRHRIETALAGKLPRLVKLSVEYTGSGRALADNHAVELRELDPEEVFARRFGRDHEGEVPAPLLRAFREIVERARDVDSRGGSE